MRQSLKLVHPKVQWWWSPDREGAVPAEDLGEVLLATSEYSEEVMGRGVVWCHQLLQGLQNQSQAQRGRQKQEPHRPRTGPQAYGPQTDRARKWSR